jgi:hypothetical protein
MARICLNTALLYIHTFYHRTSSMSCALPPSLPTSTNWTRQQALPGATGSGVSLAPTAVHPPPVKPAFTGVSNAKPSNPSPEEAEGTVPLLLLPPPPPIAPYQNPAHAARRGTEGWGDSGARWEEAPVSRLHFTCSPAHHTSPTQATGPVPTHRGWCCSPAHGGAAWVSLRTPRCAGHTGGGRGASWGGIPFRGTLVAPRKLRTSKLSGVRIQRHAEPRHTENGAAAYDASQPGTGT